MDYSSKGFIEPDENLVYRIELKLEKLKARMSEERLRAYEINRFWRIFDEIEIKTHGFSERLNDGTFRFNIREFNAMCNSYDLPSVDFKKLYLVMNQAGGGVREVVYKTPPNNGLFRVKRHTPKGDLNG